MFKKLRMPLNFKGLRDMKGHILNYDKARQGRALTNNNVYLSVSHNHHQLEIDDQVHRELVERLFKY